jgi:hypothetical protein
MYPIPFSDVAKAGLPTCPRNYTVCLSASLDGCQPSPPLPWLVRQRIQIDRHIPPHTPRGRPHHAMQRPDDSAKACRGFNGCQIKTNCPILHAKQDQVCPIGVQGRGQEPLTPEKSTICGLPYSPFVTVHPSICPFVCPSIRPSIHLLTCLSIRPSVRPRPGDTRRPPGHRAAGPAVAA